MAYSDDDMLMLSGIQHYMFCPRQWALIHLEQQWADNRLTTEGELLHSNVDNPSYRHRNGDIITLRSLQVSSKELGLYGVTDAVELLSAEDDSVSVRIPAYDGAWTLYPVEYKHGKPKVELCDKVQLAAQVVCLEEMYGIHISEAALFYWEVRRREVVSIDEDLRNITFRLATEMHKLYALRQLPSAVKAAHCRNCSLADVCMPNLSKCNSVKNYLKNNLYEETS